MTDQLRAAKQARVEAYYRCAESADENARAAQGHCDTVRALADAIQVEIDVQTDAQKAALLQREAKAVAQLVIHATKVAQAAARLARTTRERASHVAASRRNTKRTCSRLVLVVEDNDDLLGVMGQAIENLGCHVVLASNGEEALAALRKGRPRPCLILADLRMPVMDGWQFGAELLKNPEFAAIPLVIISAYRNGRTVSSNTVKRFHKPVDVGVLRMIIEQYCS